MSSPLARWSLRRRLLASLVIATLATLALGALGVFVAGQIEERAIRDHRLADLARTILSFTQHEIEEIRADGRTDRMHTETAATLGERYRYQIWSKNGVLLLHSFHASASAPMSPLGPDGFATAQLDGKAFRVVNLWSPDKEVSIQVGESEDLSRSAFASMGPLFLGVLVVPFALIVLVTWWALNGSLKTIVSSASQLSRRGPGDLRPLHAEDPPRELEPMLTAINKLFERVDQAMSIERGFTAMAAHELRTPLAGLRAHAQLAALSNSPEERQTALASIMLCVDRSAHLIQQLLDLARVEAQPVLTMSDLKRVDVATLCADILADLDRDLSAHEAHVSFDFEVKHMLVMSAGFAIMLRNLITNAVRHTPPQGKVTISTRKGAGYTVLRVDDAGPGIPQALRERVFQRFERLGRKTPDGVGLGMVIVLSVVKAHEGRIELLDSPLGGLRVSVEFPQPDVR